MTQTFGLLAHSDARPWRFQLFKTPKFSAHFYIHPSDLEHHHGRPKTSIGATARVPPESQSKEDIPQILAMRICPAAVKTTCQDRMLGL